MKASSAWSFLFLLVGAIAISAQTPPASPASAKETTVKVSACDHERALLLVLEQLEEIKLLEPKWQRVEVLLKAAPLLWSQRQTDAREVFQAAYEAARASLLEREDSTAKLGQARFVTRGDLRFQVISAIGRHDQKWARELSSKLVEEHKTQVADAKEKTTNANFYQELPMLAMSLLPYDQAGAVQLARASVGEDNGIFLGSFLFALAQVDRNAADMFFRDALAVVSQRNVRETLYLYLYPFAAGKVIGAEWQSAGDWAMRSLQPNPTLQLLYLNTLLQMTQRYSQPTPEDAKQNEGAYKLSPAAKLFLALSDLEPVVANQFPQLLGKLLEAKTALSAAMANELQLAYQLVAEKNKPADSGVSRFVEQLKKADEEKELSRKDYQYFIALQIGIESETLETLESVLLKIKNIETRNGTADWIYYTRGARMLKQEHWDEAIKIAEKITPLDLRAFLNLMIAEAVLQKANDRQRARQSLNDALRLAEKADETNEKGKALLGIASLYQKFDELEALSVLRTAIKTINHLAAPDVQSPSFLKAVKGDGFQYNTRYQMTGRGLADVFREFGKVDFESALAEARGLNDLALRADAIFSLSSYCLSQPPPKAPVAGKK